MKVETLLRDLAPQVLGIVMRRYRDFYAAEDAVQEALLAAATVWPRDGLPESPRAWLVQVAFRKLTDEHRADVARRRREDVVGKEQEREHIETAEMSVSDPFDHLVDHDDALVLLFMCCHPSLTPASSIALTLRAVGGLTTVEIAKAFMVPLATMAQRISRAKETVRESGVPFEKPSAAEWSARLAQVLHVLYLVFNEGYTSTAGPELHRPELADEAIRLTRLVHALRPDEGEVAGLLALMLLTDARRAARTSVSGDAISLDEQDRSLWDAKAIEEGVALVTNAMSKSAIGPYQLQAAIAAIHDEAKTSDATDWPQIFALYGLLEKTSDNPMISLNRVVAQAKVHGPASALARLEEIARDPRLAESHRVDAVRAHLLETAGDHAGAIAAYRASASRTTNIPEQKYLLARAARLLS